MTTSTSTIADRTAAMMEDFAAKVPAEVGQVFATEQAGLDASGAPEGAATAGTPMPDGQLLDASGQSTSLTATRQGRPTVLVFYRGAWCPYCNVALRAYEEQL